VDLMTTTSRMSAKSTEATAVSSPGYLQHNARTVQPSRRSRDSSPPTTAATLVSSPYWSAVVTGCLYRCFLTTPKSCSSRMARRGPHLLTRHLVNRITSAKLATLQRLRLSRGARRD